MTPSHATKQGRRYRYYLSQNIVTGTGAGMRISAHEIEGLVRTHICEGLRDRVWLTDALCVGGASPSVMGQMFRKAEILAGNLEADSVSDVRSVLLDIIMRIAMVNHGVCITFSRDGLRKILGAPESSTDSDNPVMEIKATLRQLGREKKLIIAGQMPKSKCDPALIKAVLRAHRWFDMLKNRKVQSISEIAIKEKVLRPYISNLLSLAFLAPDLTTAILEGRQPPDITLDRLLSYNTWPVEWGQQRAIFAGSAADISR